MSCRFQFGQQVRFTGTLWCHKCGESAGTGIPGTFIGHDTTNNQTVDVFSIKPICCPHCEYTIVSAEQPCDGDGFTHPLFEKVDQMVERHA